jgi:hypothetical protein
MSSLPPAPLLAKTIDVPSGDQPAAPVVARQAI